MSAITRRQFGALTVGGAFGAACRITHAVQSDGRMAARPRTGAKTTARSERLGLDSDRDAILQLPPDMAAAPLPLLVYLHGATQRGEGMLRRIGQFTDAAGVAVLAPDSRGTTWDAIRSDFGPDVVFLNKALQRVFDSVAVDPRRIAIGGFSDGASYAISLGLINGDLFTHVVANSPGFTINGEAHGKPRLFVSHGTSDQILPIDQCSRRIVPALKRAGYDVTYQEFEGRHEIPSDIVRQSMEFIRGTP